MTYMCNLKNTQMNAHANQKQTRRYGKQSGGYQRRGMEGGTNYGFGINRYKLLCIK